MSVPLNQPLLTELRVELEATRPLLELLPDGALDFRPHEKSMTLGRLASHIAECTKYGWQVLASDSIDSAASTTGPLELPDRAQILESFDGHATRFVAALADASDENLRAPWSYRKGDRVVFATRRISALRRFVLNHLIHHRGQLTVYLRQLGSNLPQVYGPTADDRTGY